MPVSRRRRAAALLLPALLLALFLALCGSAGAQQNPLLGGPAPNEAPSGGAGFGPLHRAIGAVIAVQTEVYREIDRRLVALRDGHGAGVILAALVVSFLYGVLHALAPGHGKTVIFGYFLGRDGSIPRGLAMAAWIAFSHVILAILTVVLLHFLLARSLATPVDQSRWLQYASDGAILAIGLVMLRNALRDRGRGAGACHHGQGHAHDHQHVHGWRRYEQRLLAVAAGFAPCSGAVLVMVFAFTNGILLSGVLMAPTIALGMGMTLAMLGIASVLMRRQATLRFAGAGGLESAVGGALGLLGPILICGIGALLLSGTLLTSP